MPGKTRTTPKGDTVGRQAADKATQQNSWRIELPVPLPPPRGLAYVGEIAG